jgi:hypothetical protein
MALCLFYHSMISRSLSEEYDIFETLVKEIKVVDLLPFEKCIEDGMTFEYRVYKKPVSLSFSRTANMPIDYGISPLYTSAIALSLVESKKLSDKECFDIFFNLFEAKESVWICLRDTLLKNFPDWKTLDKKDIQRFLKKEFNNVFCVGEIRQGNMFTLSYFTEESCPDLFEPSEPPIVKRKFFRLSFYLKNNRFYFVTSERSKSLDTFVHTSRSVLEGLHNKFVRDNPYFKPPEPPPKETWRHWETFLKDYKVEGEFIHFDGEFVTMMKRDGTKEKIKYKNLCIADQFYVDEEVEEQKKRYEKELKELPEQLAKEPYHEWITKIHDYKVTGEFVSYDGKFVTIKKSDGKTEQIEYNRLSVDDRNYVQEKLLLQKWKQKK